MEKKASAEKAVVVTLIYLAVQIRQNSNLLRKAAAESAASGAAASIALAGENALRAFGIA